MKEDELNSVCTVIQDLKSNAYNVLKLLVDYEILYKEDMDAESL